jgi:transposase
MYLARKRTPTTPVLQLLRSYRNAEGKPRHEVILSLGDFPIPKESFRAVTAELDRIISGQQSLLDVDPEIRQWAKHIYGELSRSKRLERLFDPSIFEEGVEVIPGAIEHEDARSLGPELVGLHAWKELGLDGVLKGLGFSETQVRDAAVSVINRLCDPVSEHALPRWLERSSLGDLWKENLDGLGEDRFYRISDALLGVKDQLEEKLAEQERSVFNLERSIYLYDMTNTYFEGAMRGNAIAKRGPSKEKRTDAPLVSVGLVLDGDGFVLRHRTLPGNIYEGHTLLDTVHSLDVEGGTENPLIVMDAGFSSEKNLSALRKAGYDYVTVAKRATRLAYNDEFADLESFTKIEGRDHLARAAKKDVFVKTLRAVGETILCVYSKDREAKELAMIEKAEKRLLSDLEKLKASVEAGRIKNRNKIQQRIGRILGRYPRASKYYHITHDDAGKTLNWQRDERRYQRELVATGGYIIRTNRADLEDQDIWKIYILLTKVEAGFRSLKSDLGLRPIYHQIQKRCQAHILITLLAYRLLRAIEFRLQHANLHASWTTIKHTLTTHAYVSLIIPDKNGNIYKIRKAGRPNPAQTDIYKKLGVDFEHLPTSKTKTRP